MNTWLQLIFYFGNLLLLVKPLGAYMAKVYQGEPLILDRVLGPVERLLYRLSGIDPRSEMTWKTYTVTMLVFNILGVLTVYLLQRLQGFLPLNPQGLGAVSPDSAWNTAVSFATNTNWQGYSSETTMSYLTQMLGMTVQNFVSAATGMAVMIALIRGIVRAPLSSPHFENSKMGGQRGVGNFWVDMTRSVLYILLPLSLLLALTLVSQGVVQTFSEYKSVTSLQTGESHGGTCCFANRHQATWHKQRRILQCELGAPVGKPNSILKFLGDVIHFADACRALLHLRQDGRRYTSGLGVAGSNDDCADCVVGCGSLVGLKRPASSLLLVAGRLPLIK